MSNFRIGEKVCWTKDGVAQSGEVIAYVGADEFLIKVGPFAEVTKARAELTLVNGVPVANPEVGLFIAESTLRKMQPVGTIAKEYFPLGLRGVAAVAWVGNEKHNPGQHLHWARDKSDGHLDCLGRHMTETEDWDIVELPDGRAYMVLHAAQAAWRALALAQIAAEKYGGEVVRRLK